MSNPQTIAATLCGPIAWENETRGFVKCPGADLHTHKSGPKDCRIHIDGAPTLHCCHNSCKGAIEAANLALRRALGQTPWEIILPGGKSIRNGDVVIGGGTVIPRETIKAQAVANGRTKEEQTMLASIQEMFAAQLPAVLRMYQWDYHAIETQSPRAMSHRSPEEQFRMWLRIWPQTSHVWIGDVFSSGKPKHAAHFRPAAEWSATGPMGNYTCASSFKPGTFKRGNEFTNGTQFLVVESDELDKNQVGAVFTWLNNFCNFNLHCIVDTGGKSLHGWFDRPRNKRLEQRLKSALIGLKCDPKMFTFSQPVRVPGAWRGDRLQKLIWLREAYA